MTYLLIYFGIGFIVSMIILKICIETGKQQLSEVREDDREWHLIAFSCISVIVVILSLLIWPLCLLVNIIGKSLGKAVK